MKKIRWVAPVFALMGLLTSACGGSLIQRADELPPPPEGLGFVQLRCTPPDAELYVDDRYFGVLAGYVEGVVRLPAGPHRLSLVKAGHYPWYGRVEAGPQATVITTHLVPEP